MPHTLLIFSSFSSPSQSTVCNPHTPSPTYNPHPLHPPNPQCTIPNTPPPSAVPIFLRRVPPRGSCTAATRATVAGFGTLEEILVLRRRMDYTSPAPLGLFEPRRGELESGAEISECNSYASQHLDSLRSSKPCHCCPRCRCTAPREGTRPKKGKLLGN